MVQLERFENPFTVTSPEDMSAEDAHSLFVDVFTDFPKVCDPIHTFLHGPRGSGKSMMFRYLKPDCQRLANQCQLKDLRFFAIYFPIKSTYLRLGEFQRLEGKHADVVINEHFMTIHFAEIMLGSISEMMGLQDEPGSLEAAKRLMKEHFYPLLDFCGCKKASLPLVNSFETVTECFKQMQHTCRQIYSDIKTYLKKISFSSDIIPYDNALCGYLDFLLPLLRGIKKLPFMPTGPIYLLIDDADDLSEIQTKILNSWVSTRTASEVSLKISTRHQYKTFYTTTGTRIETPHDYQEVNISTIYTSSIKGKYMGRVREIVKKRLDKSKIQRQPEIFFPEDEEQENEIKIIAQELRTKWKRGEGRGYRVSDDITRYARPDYMKSLAGPRKSSHTYSYAGFIQLVHISSGIIRYFLDAASQMYSETKSTSPDRKIDFIPPGIQTSVVRNDADRFLFEELDKIVRDKSADAPDEEKIRKLSILIQTIGSIFHVILLSDRSERRVFSIAFSDPPSNEIIEIMRLGVRYGYFYESTIGRKDSMTGGRTRLYILSRRLAPFFNLDPTSFAGYLFVTRRFIEEALHKPQTILGRIRKHGLDAEMETKQLPLFEE